MRITLKQLEELHFNETVFKLKDGTEIKGRVISYTPCEIEKEVKIINVYNEKENELFKFEVNNIRKFIVRK